MYMYMYINMYVRMYVCMYVCIYKYFDLARRMFIPYLTTLTVSIS